MYKGTTLNFDSMKLDLFSIFRAYMVNNSITGQFGPLNRAKSLSQPPARFSKINNLFALISLEYNE